ncbi:melanoma-associated antigen 8-like [Cavia porcellus]|uniref:melanoma-associated antigen 8-like n=1 Tax=Cavia porcellus TaxID=10141 RepID=UPI00035102DD|nr:melanoma-associated antigen 8-like [Cavia porcellus]
MRRSDKRQDTKLGGCHPDHTSARALMDVQDPKDEEGAAATASSASSSSCALLGATSRKEPECGSPSCPQDPKSSFPPTAVASNVGSQSCEGSIRDDDGPSTSQGKEAPRVRQSVFVNEKLDDILLFLLQKYQKNEQISPEEMLHILGGDYSDHFPLIFRELCQCMRLGFGIIMREVGSPGLAYELVPVLGLTFSGMLDDVDQIIPKANLLILVLSVIFLKGNRISEEHLREILRFKKMLAERDHVIFREPWKFITEDLVREEYLVRQRIPNSDPARYEFVWGPRAHAETTNLKVLEHVFVLECSDPRSFQHFHE